MDCSEKCLEDKINKNTLVKIINKVDKNAVDSARRMITHAVIGFIILIFAYLILQFIPQFFGFKLLLF